VDIFLFDPDALIICIPSPLDKVFCNTFLSSPELDNTPSQKFLSRGSISFDDTVVYFLDVAVGLVWIAFLLD